MYVPRATYSLRMSFWIVPDSETRRDSLTPRHRDVQRQQDDSGGVNRHRGRDALERDSVEERRHVLYRIDGDANPTDLALLPKGGPSRIRSASEGRTPR
jgi:hypothetical protein